MAGLAGGIRDPRAEFWSSPETWPEDSTSYIFAGRAITTYGDKHFGVGAIAQAAQVKLVFDLPTHLTLYTDRDEILRGLELLRVADGQQSMPYGYGFFATEPHFPTASEWERARALASEASKASFREFAPFGHSVSVLANAARDALIKTATCSRQGGKMVDEPWDFWNYPHRWLFLDCCKIEAPGIAARSYAKEWRWIYFERASFDAFLNAPPSGDVRAPASTDELEGQKVIRKRGAPQRYDWGGFERELLRRFKSGELPDSIADIAKVMAEWCQEEWGGEPSDGYLRKKITELHGSMKVSEKYAD